jgi:hypothetical protein
MKIVFALIIMSYAYNGHSNAFVGNYEKFWQCKEQGQRLLNDGMANAGYRCVPVNIR